MWLKRFNIGHWIELLNFSHRGARNFEARKTQQEKNPKVLILSLKSPPRDMYFYSYFWLPNVKILWFKHKNLRVNTVDSTETQLSLSV